MKTLEQIREAHSLAQLDAAKKKYGSRVKDYTDAVKRNEKNAQTTSKIEHPFFKKGPPTNKYFGDKLKKSQRKLELTHKALDAASKLSYEKTHGKPEAPKKATKKPGLFRRMFGG